MKPVRAAIVIGSILLIGCAVASLLNLGDKHKVSPTPVTPPVEPARSITAGPASVEPSPDAAPRQASSQPAIASAGEQSATPATPVALAPLTTPSTPGKADRRAPSLATPAPQAAPKPRLNKKEADKSLARVALNYVGMDPEAERVWNEGINDPSLPPNTRKDLIEDLNEDGFPDPRNITMEDLPLIMSRLQLIEEFAPDAMDEVNATAFAEAYKDLVNMYVRLTQ